MLRVFSKVIKGRDNLTQRFNSTQERENPIFNTPQLIKLNSYYTAHYDVNIQKMFKTEESYNLFMESGGYLRGKMGQNIVEIHPGLVRGGKKQDGYYEIDLILFTSNPKSIWVNNELINTIPIYSKDGTVQYAINGIYKLNIKEEDFYKGVYITTKTLGDNQEKIEQMRNAFQIVENRYLDFEADYIGRLKALDVFQKIHNLNFYDNNKLNNKVKKNELNVNEKNKKAIDKIEDKVENIKFDEE